MNLSTECLDEAEVEMLLQGNLNPDKFQSAQDHLESCERCRNRVEATIGSEEWWGDVQSVLRDSSSLLADGREPSGSALDNRTTDGSRRAANILDVLGPTDDPNMLGRIGPYEIIGLLGQGGMGAVFKGFDRSLNRFVAIKMLLPHLAASGAARKRFAREGQAVAAVVDDHVMAIHCVDEWQGVPYLVMTYSRGVTLQKRLSDNGPLEVLEILRIGMQAAKGLAAAHAQGIVHRDIKPANIFLDQTVERVQLMDFGLARAVDDASLTRSGTLAGTPQYMSPEQARAETVDHRSDLFSLGSVMYAMCTGQAPFRAESSYSVLRLITDKEPRPIREINPEIPDWLCAIIGKLMAKQASDRFTSAHEVAKLLEVCLAHVQQPTNELPGNLLRQLSPRSGSSNPIGLTQLFKRSGIQTWLLAGIGVTAIMLIAMVLQDKGPQQSGQREPSPLTASHPDVSELLKQLKAREESIRKISYQGTVRQYAHQDIQRTNTESVDEFVARCVGLPQVYDEVPPYPLSASRDFSSGVYRFTMGDIQAAIPKYMDWFIEKEQFVQLMGREPGDCEAVVTNKREDIKDDREASPVRLDIAAFRPVKDFLMSEVVMNATSVPGIPDVGGRPLWKLEKLDNKVGWKSTFMFQQPIADPPGAKKILWYRIYWEQIGGELVIVRVDKLTVDGDANSTPQSVLLIDDYRSVCGKPVPFRVRFFGLGNTFVYGAELLVSDLKVNDYVDVPVQMKIPTGSRVRNQITGTKSRQPASQNSDPTTDAELIQGTWNVVEMQQIGYEPSEGEKEFYKNGGYKITFTKNKMIASVDHSSMKYRVDATESPGVLELLKDEQVIAKAIYELDGDELRICQGRTPTDGTDPKAPPSFDIKQAASEFPTLMVLRRTKAIEPVAYMHSVQTNARPSQQASAELLIEARKALQVYQDSLGWKQKLDMRVTNLQVHADVGKVTTDTRIRRDAPRMVTSSVQTFDDQPKDHIRLDNWALDDGEMFIGRTTTIGFKKLTGLMTIKGRQKSHWKMLEASFAMEGYFPGNQGKTLMELLLESKNLDVRIEKIGDLECLRISDSNEWGIMTVWIDRGPSRLLRQWESFKERNNRYSDGHFGEDKDTANWESFSHFVDNIKYQTVDGIEIAVSCRLRSSSVQNGGAKFESSAEYQRTEINLHPDFSQDNPFVGDFDDGARINDGDSFDRNQAYYWKDGKLTQ